MKKLLITCGIITTILSCSDHQVVQNFDNLSEIEHELNTNLWFPRCGDGVCSLNETTQNCSQDCHITPQCFSNQDCINENPCKLGVCNNSFCSNSNKPNGTWVHTCDEIEDGRAYHGICYNGDFDIIHLIQCSEFCSPFEGEICTYNCGNGVWAFETEDCDDGNFSDGDGCSSTCMIEPGFDCHFIDEDLPFICTYCGDGDCVDYETHANCPMDCD